MVACPVPRRGAASTDRGGTPPVGEAGLALLDVVVASVVLLVIMVPAAQLLVTSGKVVGASRDQAIAEGAAAAQLAQDRAWSSTTSPPTYTSSSSCGSAYSSGTTNTTFNQYLTGCRTVSGLPLWIFQNGGWCVTSGSTLASGSSGVLMYWVEVMVTWGGTAPPSPSTVVSSSKRVVVSSSLVTPNGYTGSTSGSCPL